MGRARRVPREALAAEIIILKTNVVGTTICDVRARGDAQIRTVQMPIVCVDSSNQRNGLGASKPLAFQS